MTKYVIAVPHEHSIAFYDRKYGEVIGLTKIAPTVFPNKKKAKRLFQYLSDELKSRDYTPGTVDDVLEKYLDKDKETLSPNELKNRETIESLNKSNDFLANINSAVEVIKAQMLGDKTTMYSLMTNEEKERFDKNVLRQADISSFKSIKVNAQIRR